MRTVYLGTSDFAAAVLERLAQSPHRPVLVVTRPDRPRGRGRRPGPPPVAERARALGIELIQPEDLHAPEALARIAAAEPEALCVCAYGAIIKDPLLGTYELFNVHPSLLPRWRGAAPVERAIMAGDAETGVCIMRVEAGLDSGPVCSRAAEPIAADDDYGTLAGRLQRIGGDLLVAALGDRPPWVAQDEDGVTYAEKITAADRMLDPTRAPDVAERTVRALRPHIGARIPLPSGEFLGVWAAGPAGETLAPAGGRVRAEGDRLFLDCNGGALELLEIQPPGGRRMAAADWLRGRPDPALTDFWLDPRLPDADLETVVQRACAEWDQAGEWAPHIAALCWRGSPEVLDAMRALAGSAERRDRCVAAFVLGQLGVPQRTFAEESARALESMARTEHDPGVLATIANALGNLGEGYGTETLLGLRSHQDAAVRDGVARALAGRDDDRAVMALMELSRDADGEIRDWSTFALGALAQRDTDDLRQALVARLHDENDEARVEAVHGLALRGDLRAVEPALELLDRGVRDGPWHTHALELTAVRLAVLSGDVRFQRHLPPIDRYSGTILEDEVRRAHHLLDGAT